MSRLFHLRLPGLDRARDPGDLEYHPLVADLVDQSEGHLYLIHGPRRAIDPADLLPVVPQVLYAPAPG